GGGAEEKKKTKKGEGGGPAGGPVSLKDHARIETGPLTGWPGVKTPLAQLQPKPEAERVARKSGPPRPSLLVVVASLFANHTVRDFVVTKFRAGDLVVAKYRALVHSETAASAAASPAVTAPAPALAPDDATPAVSISVINRGGDKPPVPKKSP